MLKQTLKKTGFRILCNRVTGSIIKGLYHDRIPDIRWRGFRFSTENTGMQRWVEAAIFWGFYEGAEIRFIEKFFKGDTDVLELGASSGIVSAHIIAKMQRGHRLISVEANRSLEVVWRENTSRHNVNDIKTELLNYAVHYDGDTVLFDISDNTTESRLSTTSGDREDAAAGGAPIAANLGKMSTAVPAIQIGKIVKDYGLDKYSLFCDIEGAEIDMLLNEDEALLGCRDLFIELHDAESGGKKYNAAQLADLIRGKGFRLADQYGNVFYFTREDIDTIKN